MGGDKGPFSWFKKLFSNDERKLKGKYQYLLIIGLIGVAIMILSNFFSTDEQNTHSFPVSGKSEGSDNGEVETFGRKSSEGKTIKDYENEYETQLKEALEGIAGVTDVTVVVNVDATESQVLEKNTVTRSQVTDEVDREGGERKVEDQSKEEQIVIIREGDKEIPIVLETRKPKIRGVLVVAKGADNIQVKKWIVESVTKLLDVPSHRVSVMPKK